MRQEVSLVVSSHETLKESLESMQEQSQHILSATYTNTARLRREVAAGSQAVFTLSVSMEDSFSQVYGKLGDMERVHREQAQLLAELRANSLGLVFARFLSSFSYPPAVGASGRTFNEEKALAIRSRVDEVTTGPVIIGALLLAGRAPAHREQMAWAGLAFALFIIRLLSRLYRDPVVVHIIFVKGFCDDEYEVPVNEARSPAVRCAPYYSSHLV